MTARPAARHVLYKTRGYQPGMLVHRTDADMRRKWKEIEFGAGHRTLEQSTL